MPAQESRAAAKIFLSLLAYQGLRAARIGDECISVRRFCDLRQRVDGRPDRQRDVDEVGAAYSRCDIARGFADRSARRRTRQDIHSVESNYVCCGELPPQSEAKRSSYQACPDNRYSP